VQKVFPKLGVKKEDFVWIAGIGCSSRFPYYMDTYGMHGIHGRAPAIATGLKVAHPELSVWVSTGDGDLMSIGGNHFIHAIRRNIDINILLFNNQIYGLTKGQYSPTTAKGCKTKSSPFGTVEEPFRPGELVLGARGQFFARTIDVDLPNSKAIFLAADAHKGTSVVESLQNCIIFNDKVHAAIVDKEHRADRTILLEHGEPMIFGKNRDKGLIADGLRIKVAEIGKDGVTEADILVHDAHDTDTTTHTQLANLQYPDYPVVLGIIRDVDTETYDSAVATQIAEVQETAEIKTLDALLNSGHTWMVN
jgi:2-oxoglutarate ferredoxin oxidoreductase subunit beta